jgi:hypothetical protein
MEATIATREEAEVTEGAGGELGEILARVDERFDQWLERIDERLVRIEVRGTERFTETARRLDYVGSQLERTNDRLDSMVRVMIAGNVSLTVGILAGFVSIVALILTQL